MNRYVVVLGASMLVFGSLSALDVNLSWGEVALFAIATNAVVFGAMGFPGDD